MGISSSLNAGVSGLNANANKLATISDNIANSQTYGYKRADVDFSSLTVSDSRSPNTVGGGRWFTAGGVRTNAIWDIEAKGALTTHLERHRHRADRARVPAGHLDRLGRRHHQRQPAVHADDDRLVPARRQRLPAHALGAGADGLAGRPQRRHRAAAARQRVGPVADPDQPLVGRGAADLADRPQRQPAGDRDPGRIGRRRCCRSPSSISTTSAPRRRCRSSSPRRSRRAGDPQTNTWTLEIIDQASGQSARQLRDRLRRRAAERRRAGLGDRTDRRHADLELRRGDRRHHARPRQPDDHRRRRLDGRRRRST